MITTENLLSISGGDTRRRVMSGLNAYINSDPEVRSFVSAFMECDPQTQEIVKQMMAIICDDSADEDEKDLANETVIEALFPSLMVECENAYDAACETAGSREAEDSLNHEEAMFADRVRTLMDDRGMKQEELAMATGVSQPAISNILNRSCRPRRATVAKFAEALGVTPQELWPE